MLSNSKVLRFGFAVFVFMAMDLRAEPDPKLAARLDALLNGQATSGVTYVARVVHVSSGRELYLHDPDRPVMPASNGKLANDAAGLDRFGPAYAWKTYLALDGDDLWLIGTGDPATGDEVIEEKHKRKRMQVLDDFAAALAERGVTRVKGKLIVDDGIFDDERISPTWSKSYLTDWYAAPVTGLALNDNCIDVTAYPGRFEVVPETQGVTVIDRTRQAGDAEPLAIEREPDADVFTLTGLVTKKEKAESKAIRDPGLFFADALRTRLKARGIAVDGPTERAARELAREKWGKLKDHEERDARVVATHETPMADVLARINKNSQNLFAEAMCKLQGRAWSLEHGRDEPGSWRAGGEAVHAFLRRQGIDDAAYVLIDGSGLSRDNRVTARLVSDVLLAMSRHKYAAEYRASLTVAGKDGTLKKRLTDIAGAVQGKTGSIGGVRSLSGYLTTRAGELLVFSMIFNDAPRKAEPRCVELMDDACRVMYEWPAVEKATLKGTATTAPATNAAE